MQPAQGLLWVTKNVVLPEGVELPEDYTVTLTVTENGVKVGEMEPCEEFDPDYVDLYATVTNKTTRKYCQPAKSFHMFRIKPSAGVKAGEVRVTDRFGTTYVEHVSW